MSFFKVDEEKRSAKLESMRVKAKRIEEYNNVSGKLEKARGNRAKIKKATIKRKTAGLRIVIKDIKSSKKGSGKKKRVSSSPFSPDKW
jgi:hypothetical protein